MSFEQSFLARIRDVESGGLRPRSRSASGDMERLAEAVREHLAGLLNSRHGMSDALPDYGLPALSDLVASGEDWIRRLREEVKATITTFEPRLANVSVTLESGEEQQRVLLVKAVLVASDVREHVSYLIELSREGYFEVSD